MKKVILLMLAVIALTSVSAQTKVAGVELPNTETYNGQTLQLNGAGVREKFWIDLYAGGLYLTTKSSDAAAIMAKNEAMSIKLHIVSKLITSEKMVDAVNEGFEKSTSGNTAALSPKIEKFKSFFMAEIKRDDIFDIVYLPSKGVIVYKNDKELGVIEGMEFKKALFGIWLSNKPADNDLKKAMLGK
ncbi:chalcone isomerase family protein [Christiangramia salexigens]|uniref:Chalcone isomerase n=1 Tax=Christiangramia salexigens TaxID=1913577 RepID=A0A1L3J3K0_9FLAO|nr:chalcone isomerase family protein [Christiangramia salexigens]APG59696.1 chalcone isomerase [Christiangramia salexigens]